MTYKCDIVKRPGQLGPIPAPSVPVVNCTPLARAYSSCIFSCMHAIALSPGPLCTAQVIKKQLAEGVTRRRVGLVAPSGAPPREHAEILSEDGKKIGEITSGGHSPCLRKNIAMGYVAKGFTKAGTPLKVSVRGKVNDAVVTKMPFVETTYYKG